MACSRMARVAADPALIRRVTFFGAAAVPAADAAITSSLMPVSWHSRRCGR